LIDIAEACATGRLNQIDIRWKTGAAACVVIASEGYPGSSPNGREIRGLDMPLKDAVVFQAGTKLNEGKVVTAGGRVLGVTGFGDSFRAAIEHAYLAVKTIDFAGMQYRSDIGRRALEA